MTFQLVFTFIVPKLQQQVQDVTDNALQSIENSNYELQFVTKSNEFGYLLVNATTVGVVGVAQDVTESKRNDLAVAAIANELRQLVETANALIFGSDVDRTVNEWNNNTAKITSYSKEEGFNRPLFSMYIVLKLQQQVQEVMDNALLEIERSNYNLDFETKYKETQHLLVNATIGRDHEGNAIGVVWVAN